MFERYKSYSPYDMLESIKKEVKGDLENAFLNSTSLSPFSEPTLKRYSGPSNFAHWLCSGEALLPVRFPTGLILIWVQLGRQAGRQVGPS